MPAFCNCCKPPVNLGEDEDWESSDDEIHETPRKSLTACRDDINNIKDYINLVYLAIQCGDEHKMDNSNESIAMVLINVQERLTQLEKDIHAASKS